ncbi:hypothetical protein P692DRAFT_201706736 [Suillus brevipes Sb2]|nr:hypothetical protein P692DRAFT_201706736 [Suillus brevipes Sb2]
MVSQSFMATHGRKRVQAQAPHCAKVSLSKEARTALTAQRCDKSFRFKTDLHSAWSEIDETMKSIASSHHKSFRRVQNELCMGHGMLHYQRSKLNAWNAFCWKKRTQEKENGATGKAVLQELVKDEENRAEYRQLTEVEKTSLLAEYAEHKETKSSGICISVKAKVNDVTQTLKAVENEASLTNLRARTGAETILYTTRGSTDCPLRGVAFATEGVCDFMSTVMNVDSQDLVSKMEGFSVQGMQGAVKNHQKRTSAIWSAIHDEINKALREITQDLKARMHWAHYWRNVVQRHIEEDEYEKLLQERNEKLERGDVVEECRWTRSDKGKKHDTTSQSKKSYKSAEIVASDEEDETTPAAASPHAANGLGTPSSSDTTSGGSHNQPPHNGATGRGV